MKVLLSLIAISLLTLAGFTGAVTSVYAACGVILIAGASLARLIAGGR